MTSMTFELLNLCYWCIFVLFYNIVIPNHMLKTPDNDDIKSGGIITSMHLLLSYSHMSRLMTSGGPFWSQSVVVEFTF